MNLNGSVFDKVDKSTCTLFVPTGTKSQYQAATGWKDFINIVEFNASGLNDINTEPLKIFPNPAQSYVKLDLGDRHIKDNLIIYNAQGQKVYESRISKKLIQLDVSNYSAGMYFIQLQGEHNFKQQMGRFIKN